MPSAATRSRRILRKGAEHIVYEFEQMKAAASLIANTAPDSVERNLLLEAFLIHVRTTVRFFHSTESFEIRAVDFGGHSSRTRYARWQFKKLLDHISKHLAHGAWRRTRSKIQWPVSDLTRDLLAAYADLRAALPKVDQRLFPVIPPPTGAPLAPMVVASTSSAPTVVLNTLSAGRRVTRRP